MENTGIITYEKSELLDIFLSDEDRKGTDLLKMSNYFDVLVSKIDTQIDAKSQWEVVIDSTAFIGRIATAIKSGFDLSEINMLVADTSHFSQEIVDGLKKGIYHIGQSREVAGNFRPAVLDENERLIKFVTLKKVINPSEILGDVSTLTIQMSLRNISSQIEDVGREVRSISDFVRRENLSNRFIYARDKIMLAAADREHQEQLLMEADTYLMNGLTDLYVDVNAEIQELAKLHGPFRSLQAADTLLAHINEDMQMIPRYVGMRVYLFNLRGKPDEVNRVLAEYQYHLENLVEQKIGDQKYTALEMIHRYYPYGGSDTDFWLYQPKDVLATLKTYHGFLETAADELYYIDTEE
jgi:hypothetical protein